MRSITESAIELANSPSQSVVITKVCLTIEKWTIQTRQETSYIVNKNNTTEDRGSCVYKNYTIKKILVLET